MKDLKEVLGRKKKEKEGDDVKKEAKLGVLKDLRGMASGMMRDGMKTTVMAKDKEGMEEGLEKAKDVVEEMPESGDSSPEEAGEDYDLKEIVEDCDPEDIDSLIKMLEEKKRSMSRG